MFFPFFIGFKDEVKQQQQKKNQWLKRAECQTGKVGRAALSPPQTLCLEQSTKIKEARHQENIRKMFIYVHDVQTIRLFLKREISALPLGTKSEINKRPGR